MYKPAVGGTLSFLATAIAAYILSSMELRDQDIQDFQAIWQAEFGETISADVARARASDLIELFLIFQKLWPKIEARHKTSTPSHEVPPLLPQIK